MLTTLLAAVIVLGPVIVFHEFGHFIVAKLAGIYVKTFSVGFGPKLLKFRIGETQYAVSAIPLGGYVRMAGESVQTQEETEDADSGPEDSTAETTAPAEAAAEAPRRVGETVLYARDEVLDGDIPPHRYFRNKPLATRLAVVTAGPFANLVLAVVVMTAVLFHEGESVLPTTTLDDVPASSEEFGAGFRQDDVLVEIAAVPVTNTREIAEALLAAPPGPVPVRLRRAGADTSIVLSGVRTQAGRIEFPRLPFRFESRIGSVKKDGPADRAGLQSGDRVVEIAGRPIRYYDELADVINPAIGEELEIVWERDGRRMSANVVPEGEEVLVDGSLTETQRIGRIQVEPYRLVMPVSLGRAFTGSLDRTWSFTRDTGRFLWTLLRGRGSADSVGGPIRIGQVAGSALRWGYSMLFYFMAFFSVNLFLLNMLPIPVLDGGHVLFMIIEAIRGEALPVRVQEFFLKVGVSALIALMGYVVIMDIKRLFTN